MGIPLSLQELEIGKLKKIDMRIGVIYDDVKYSRIANLKTFGM